jgi:general nucleoside transport system ATP-binding protein
MLSLQLISKRFAAVQALDQVSLTAQPGQVHGILGENGAGKSTLMQVLFGLLPSDHGHMTWQGKPYAPRSPYDAYAVGIAMVHQHFSLIPTLSVLANIVLAVEKKWWGFPAGKWQQRVSEIAQRYGWDIPCDALVETLPIAVQQRVEIIKALLILQQHRAENTCLVLDEPTAALAQSEVGELLHTIRRIAADGATVLFISHKLREIQQLCSEVTVLRRGRVVHRGPADVDAAVLTSALIGHDVVIPQRAAQPAPSDAPIILSGEQLSLRTKSGVLTDISFTVRAGEIVAIAGVAGNGQQQLVELLRGHVTANQGIYHNRASAIGYIPEDRARDALVTALSMRDNVMLKHYRQSRFNLSGWLRLSAWFTFAEQLRERNAIRTDDVMTPVAHLSGGNQQKVVIARELADNPDCIIAVNPTRGLDIAAAAYVLQQLIAARNRGAAVLLIHHELDDIFAVADRILVMHAGRLSDSGYPACESTFITELMTGMHP